MTCGKCQSGKIKKFGVYGRKRIQRFRCTSCGATFSVPGPKPLGEHRLNVEKAVQVISFIMEGMSINATSRLTGVHKVTILSLLLTAGDKAQQLLDKYVRKVRPRFI